MLNRRRFLTLMGAGTTGAIVTSACGGSSGVTTPIADSTTLDPEQTQLLLRPISGAGFGRLQIRDPDNIDELRGFRNGSLARSLLAVPAGFKYTALSITGQAMDDGNTVPSLHDGMACFAGPGNNYTLIRNHEIFIGGPTSISNPGIPQFDSSAFGGTTTLVVDPNGRLVRHFVSLAGTFRNCAGGPTPWRTWLSCEETTETPATLPILRKKHGYVFEVPVDGSGIANPEPLIGLGRFNHEAAAVDPTTGFVYLTEDRGTGCFYRFRPNVYGDLKSGGVLEALRLSNEVINTGSGVSRFIGREFPVGWVTIDDPDPDEDTVAQQAQAKNAAIFRRGEGAWYSNGLIYFVCTTGGDAEMGQVWQYNTQTAKLSLFYEASSDQDLDNPDNVTVGPDGTLFLCEDGSGFQYVAGLTRGGEPFRMALNLTDFFSEFAGACFSPDGRKLFFNNQITGVTFCLWREDDQPITV